MRAHPGCCRFVRCSCCEAGAGASSRQPSHFLLLRQKKVTKEKATPLAAALRFATGSLRCSLFAGSAQTRFAQTRAALIREKLRSSATARGDLESNAPWRVLVWIADGREFRVLAHASTPCTRTHTWTHACPCPCPCSCSSASAYARTCSRPRAARPLVAERSDGPSISPLRVPRSGAFRGSGPRVFEPQASLRGPREKRAPQVARSEAKGHAQWGRLFFGYFLLAKQKKVTRLPGRRPGSSL
ncbi:hypothetical protein H4CHR_01873 [Variovorax sp. PBS-H4]|nr:hypothetical protein H4CHR_01873 [Variovorax sp. PBS-H4]